MYGHNYLPQPSTFWRRGIYEEVRGLHPQWDLTMDADMWARFAERYPRKQDKTRAMVRRWNTVVRDREAGPRRRLVLHFAPVDPGMAAAKALFASRGNDRGGKRGAA